MEHQRKREKIVKRRTRVECGLDFSPHAEHVRNFSRWRVTAHRNWRADEIISRLTNPRRACHSQVSFAWFFFIAPFPLFPSPSSLYPLVSAARSDDALKLKTLEMGHSRHLFLSLSFFLLLSSSFFPCSVLRRMPSWKGSRTERKSQSFRRMPFKLFIRISRSWGRAMTGRSNECGVNRLQETQKITSWYEAREETSLSWLNEQEPSVSLKDPRWFLI